jgi:putative transcriptional regulator
MKNNIRVQRAIHRLTQQDVADKIGVSRQTINAMELGKYIPSTLLALKLAQLFRVAVEEIFSLEESDAKD